MVKPLSNLLLEYPGADIILHSHDFHYLLVPKSYIVSKSPVLGELIHKALVGRPDDANDVASLPVVQLPESGAILHSLITFILPLIPLVPSTTELSMELLSVAQKYQMDSVLAHIRLSIARQYPPPTQRGAALYVYSLAQRYGLRQETLQSARIILNYPIEIDDLEDRLDVVSGASLYELWKYSEKARSILVSDLTEFRTSGAPGIFMGLNCVQSDSSEIPSWLDDYIASIGDTPSLFDIFEFNTALVRHVSGTQSNTGRCACRSIPGQTIRKFREALASVIDGSFAKVSMLDVHELLTKFTSLQAESALSLVQEREDSQAQVNSTTSVSEALNVTDANVIIQSSDLVNFHVHKSVLAMASPVFKDLFSLQPSASESVDGLPVAKLTEDAELLNCLFSMLYPVHLVIPKSYDKVLYLLAACQKYDMGQIQAFIRDEVSRGRFPTPVGAEVFGAYAIASGKRLIPEMENAARLTLDHPMTLETLGEKLQLFEGSALYDLARFRKRCRDNLVTCLHSFLNPRILQLDIWMSCTNSRVHSYKSGQGHSPSWLTDFFKQRLTDLDQAFVKPLLNPLNIRKEYMSALQTHTMASNQDIFCVACILVHSIKGETFCTELENRLAKAITKVRDTNFGRISGVLTFTQAISSCVRVYCGSSLTFNWHGRSLTISPYLAFSIVTVLNEFISRRSLS
jgi:BTB/POZ domain